MVRCLNRTQNKTGRNATRSHVSLAQHPVPAITYVLFPADAADVNIFPFKSLCRFWEPHECSVYDHGQRVWRGLGVWLCWRTHLPVGRGVMLWEQVVFCSPPSYPSPHPFALCLWLKMWALALGFLLLPPCPVACCSVSELGWTLNSLEPLSETSSSYIAFGGGILSQWQKRSWNNATERDFVHC